MSLHRLRDYNPDTDEGMVLISWTAEFIRSPTFRKMDHDIAFSLARPHILEMMKRPSVEIKMLVPADSDEPIEGYYVKEGPVLHMLFIVGSFRGQGLMRQLLTLLRINRGDRVTFSTDTRDLRRVIASGKYQIDIRPELILIDSKKRR